VQCDSSKSSTQQQEQQQEQQQAQQAQQAQQQQPASSPAQLHRAVVMPPLAMGALARPRASSVVSQHYPEAHQALGALSEQQRRWGIVRSVVLDTPRAQSIAAAVVARNTAANGGGADGAKHAHSGADAGSGGGGGGAGDLQSAARAASVLVSDYGSGTPMRSLLLNFRSAKAAYIRKRLGGRWFKYDVAQKQHGYILDPRKRTRRTWDVIIMFFVLFTAVSVPYDTAFSPAPSDARRRFEHAIDAVFAVDVALNFITGRVDKTGKLMNEPREIARRYLSKWFALDVAATLPWEMIFTAARGGGAGGGTHLRLLAFLKVRCAFAARELRAATHASARARARIGARR
jgi:hypothetical protein